jgi:predicted MFS family arabinose efflux permease
MSVWAAIAVGGGAVGLLLGGVLTDVLSWPWIFFVNVPVGIAVFVASQRRVPESKDPRGHKTYDVAGAVTVTAGLLILVYTIVKAQEKGWGSLHTLGFGAFALALLGGFLLLERRSPEPLVPLSIFRVRTIRAANVAMFLLAAGIFAMFYFNSLYMQRVLGYSPLEAGLGSLPFTLGIMVGAGVAQQLVAKAGAREAALIGVVLAVVGLLLFVRLEPGSTYLSGLLPPIIVVAVGMGLAFVPVTLIATSGVGEQTAGLASGLFNTSQQIGGALGLAVLATLAASETSGTLSDLGHAPQPADQAQALVNGFHVAFVGSAIIVGAAGASLLLLLRRKDVEAVSTGEPALVET